jgi:hypothetical protein
LLLKTTKNTFLEAKLQHASSLPLVYFLHLLGFCLSISRKIARALLPKKSKMQFDKHLPVLRFAPKRIAISYKTQGYLLQNALLTRAKRKVKCSKTQAYLLQIAPKVGKI